MTAFSLSGHVDSPDCPCGPWVNRWGIVLAHTDERVPKGIGLMVELPPSGCPCGDPDPAGCMNLNAGYPFCRPCGEHHRSPECAIDEQGRSLSSEGVPWEELP